MGAGNLQGARNQEAAAGSPMHPRPGIYVICPNNTAVLHSAPSVKSRVWPGCVPALRSAGEHDHDEQRSA